MTAALAIYGIVAGGVFVVGIKHGAAAWQAALVGLLWPAAFVAALWLLLLADKEEI